MLENSIWSRYHKEQSIHEVLTALLKVDETYLTQDEGELYATLKRVLTKKELRLFVMSEAKIEAAVIAAELGMESESFEKAKKKTYGKLKGTKLAQQFKTAHQNENNS